MKLQAKNWGCYTWSLEIINIQKEYFFMDSGERKVGNMTCVIAQWHFMFSVHHVVPTNDTRSWNRVELPLHRQWITLYRLNHCMWCVRNTTTKNVQCLTHLLILFWRVPLQWMQVGDLSIYYKINRSTVRCTWHWNQTLNSQIRCCPTCISLKQQAPNIFLKITLKVSAVSWCSTKWLFCMIFDS